jgi:hypothetical protein
MRSARSTSCRARSSHDGRRCGRRSSSVPLRPSGPLIMSDRCTWTVQLTVPTPVDTILVQGVCWDRCSLVMSGSGVRFPSRLYPKTCPEQAKADPIRRSPSGADVILSAHDTVVTQDDQLTWAEQGGVMRASPDVRAAVRRRATVTSTTMRVVLSRRDAEDCVKSSGLVRYANAPSSRSCRTRPGNASALAITTGMSWVRGSARRRCSTSRSERSGRGGAGRSIRQVDAAAVGVEEHERVRRRVDEALDVHDEHAREVLRDRDPPAGFGATAFQRPSRDSPSSRNRAARSYSCCAAGTPPPQDGQGRYRRHGDGR